jgi:hypothetical protein
MRNPIPILTAKDLKLAVRTVRAGHFDNAQEVRLKIIERAKVIGAENVIPANWNEDGTLNDG